MKTSELINSTWTAAAFKINQIFQWMSETQKKSLILENIRLWSCVRGLLHGIYPPLLHNPSQPTPSRFFESTFWAGRVKLVVWKVSCVFPSLTCGRNFWSCQDLALKVWLICSTKANNWIHSHGYILFPKLLLCT